jgi:Phosphate-selective porin O and P
MSRRLPRYPVVGLAVIGALLLLLAPLAASAQVVVKVNDTVNFRFGLQLQGWADWTQDPNSEGYSQNMFLRRIRAQILATVAPGVSIFYQTDNPRLGNGGADGNKIIATGFETQDAFVEWKLCADMIMLDAGEYLVPTNRNGLTSTASFLALDIGTWALQGNGIMKGDGGRDYGAGFHGYLLDTKLEYRLAAFDGNRNPTSPQAPPLGPAAGSRNPYRFAGRLQYDFLDSEDGDSLTSKYVYAGTNRGLKKILAVGAWGDGQGDYKAYGGDIFFDAPLVGKDALTAEFDYSHFEGGNDFPTLAKQDDVYAQVGWFFDAVKLQPFARYENLNFSNQSDKSKNQQRYMAGLNYYIYGQNLKLTAAWERIIPKTQPVTAAIKNTNHFVVQIQALYF